jgi:TusA-related sulfurtransferase
LGTSASYILDLRESIPPITLLKISQAFRNMKPGEILEILYRDPDTRRDVFKVISPVAFDLIVMEELVDEPASVRVQMKKK